MEKKKSMETGNGSYIRKAIVLNFFVNLFQPNVQPFPEQCVKFVKSSK